MGTGPSGWEWQCSQSVQGATELGFPGPALWKMQGEPSGEGEKASSEGLGGHQLLVKTDASWPAAPATVLAVKKDRRFL